jgi:threonine dehydratase
MLPSLSLPAMKAALDAGHRVMVPAASTIADGIGVRRVGDHTFDLARRYVDLVVTVVEEEIANAILLLLEIEKTVVEGAGAVPLAALVNKRVSLDSKTVVLVLSGGNIDVNLIARIIERGLVKDGRVVRLAVMRAIGRARSRNSRSSWRRRGPTCSTSITTARSPVPASARARSS